MKDGWLSLGGGIAVGVFFVIGAFLAWFSWTQIARTRVFHLPPYTPSPWIIAAGGAIWAVLWYGLVLLGFGIAPQFPPFVAITGGLILVAVMLGLLPRWTRNEAWTCRQDFAVVAGTMIGSMGVSFVGFIGAAPRDLYFKVIVDALAVIFLWWLGKRVGPAKSASEV